MNTDAVFGRPATCPLARVAIAAWLLLAAGIAAAAEPPRFIVPGHEEAMKALEDLHALHAPQAFSPCTLWDGWLPHATLWTGPGPRAKYAAALKARPIDAEGYVSMQQHRGMAHSEGWPFPAWQQAGGRGFHFSTLGDVFAIQLFALAPLASADGFDIDGATVKGIDPVRGLVLAATGDVVTITTPPFRCGTIVAPFARIEWAARGLGAASRPAVSWLLDGEAEWEPSRRVEFPRLAAEDGIRFANVPLYRQPGYAGILTRYRIVIDHAAGAEIDLTSVITAIDTRHPTTGPLFIRACSDVFNWTADLAFLRETIGRMRQALRFTIAEFAVREQKHVFVRWVGHDGRSGLETLPEGGTRPRTGLGVGNNYWDLLPFGGHDAAATIVLYTTLRRMADLERVITARPTWGIPADGGPFAADDLTALADAVRADFQTRFWNAETGRFVGWIDRDGKAYDYGFTCLNLEAIDAGLAAPKQARSILDWLDGRREVEGDTSRGADIYHWRFGPRATTRRNVETYAWVWSDPASIPWGGQVQDGGAVLGFSSFDVSARLEVNGPDDAWRRLEEILGWFREVQAEGGYRTYYAKPGRGTLQGGGTAGGLGVDAEFLESVLVPQVMLCGFLGFRPGPTGFTVEPRLPRDWPTLTVTGIHLHDRVIDVTVEQGGAVRIDDAGVATDQQRR
jgi:hypothetical protein